MVPAFYDRGPDGLPPAWIARMKQSMRGLSAFFSSDRMVSQYAQKLYLPAGEAAKAMAADGFAETRATAARAARLARAWDAVRVGEVKIDAPYDLTLGEAVAVEAPVFLGDVEVDDVLVEVHGGLVDSDRAVTDGEVCRLERVKSEAGDGWHVYRGEWTPRRTGHSGCTLRVRPRFERDAPARDLVVKFWE